MNILEFIFLIFEFAPIILVFAIILGMMYSARKTNIQKSKSDIFGFIFVILYAIVFIGTIVAGSLGYKNLSLIGFAIILFSIIGLLLFGALSNSSTKPKTNATLITTGRIINYQKHSTKRNADGNKIDYYTITFNYNTAGTTKECTTLKEYTLAQIQYLQSLQEAIVIKVCNKYCEIQTKVNHIRNERLRSTAPHPAKVLKAQSLYSIDLIATIFCVLPIIIGAIVMAVTLWESNTIISIIIIAVAVIPNLIPIINAYRAYSIKMSINKKGTHATTRDYTITQLSNRRYIVEYSYQDNYGNTRYDKERLDADIYFAIKSINGPLPIIVYDKDSIVDVNLINDLKNNR
ncbi:MAG: hypothetical protein J6V40_05870 [Clostridia bacterium]|nr:hypothetical protein [Clostridia bacterium]